VDSYRITAKYYDGAYAAKQDLLELPFYLELAAQSAGPVLEIACGTGRILLLIARRGVTIHGVDNSQPMLEILKKNLAAEAESVRRQVTLHEGDMREFSLGGRFPLVIIPFRPLQHMYTVRDQLSALARAAHHLTNDGILAFDVFFPKFEKIHSRIGEEILEMEWSLASDATKIVRRYFRKESVSKINQVLSFNFIYRTYRAGEMILEEALKLSYFTYPHLRALFLLAGLEPVAEYGSFAKAPLDNNAEEMIFLLRKRRIADS
jgi:SAM-dependent methyltransferase